MSTDPSGLLKCLDKEGPLIPLAFFRIILGFMMWRHAWFFIDNNLIDRFYRDKFFLPYFDWYPLPSQAFYIFLLGIMILSGLFLIIGYRSKEAAILAFISVTFHLFLNQIWYRHNRYFFLLMLLLLVLSPAHRVFSLSSANSYNTGKTWTFFMIRLQMTLTYLSSAFAKTLDSDWNSGNVLRGRMYRLVKGNNMGNENLPFNISDWWAQLVTSDFVVNLMTYLALAQEYFLGICLWIPQTRKLALWVGVIFHGSIEYGASVLVFSYASLATYFVVVRPTTRDRKFYFNPEIKNHQIIASFIAHFDWLNKIVLYETRTNELKVEDADGKRYRGWMSFAIGGSCMVIPYIVAYPLTWLKHFGVGVDSEITDDHELNAAEFILLRFPGQWLLTGLVAIALIYQFFLWILIKRHISWNLQDLSPLDSILILVIFYMVATYYRSESKRRIGNINS